MDTTTAIARSSYFNVYIDLVVLGNVVLVGLEVDNGSNGLYVPRIFIASSYALDLILRLLADRLTSWRPMAVNLVNLALLACLVVDIMQNQYTWLWRASLLRMLRYLRIYKIAERQPLLAELWAVLGGLGRASRALAWFALSLAIILYASAAAVTGLVGANTRPPPSCVGQDLRVCFNAHEYFGSVPRSMLTMLQIATLDMWSSHVVRPLMLSEPLAAVVLVLFACVTAYGLLSVAVGVLVWSTVELARHHGDQDAVKGMREDSEIISQLAEYFEATLMVEERTELIFSDLEEGMLIPGVAVALKDLQLPVQSIVELFDHLDKKREGHITVENMRKGLAQLKMPATRFDIACLSATIGGSCTFTKRVEKRSVSSYEKLCKLSVQLDSAFSELELLHLPGGQMAEMPELVLRKNGRIENGVPLSTPRYS